MTILPMPVSAAERERLENCVKEPIRRPGSIQPHGVLLGVDTAWTIVQASRNTDALLGIRTEDLLGTSVAGIIGDRALDHLKAVVAGRLGASNPVRVESGGLRFDAIVHEIDGIIVVELETALPDHEFASVPEVYAAVVRLARANTREQLWADAARELHQLTGFDRVMIYHFHADGHGQVVAEERADDSMEPYLGLHYPASDIPAQARDLYLTKVSRTIFSTSEFSYPLLPAESPSTGEPLDLSPTELRSVSPHHLQFMRNMGQASTVSFSLIVGGELVGMITCAHRTPRRLPFALRQSLEVFANQVAVHLNAMAEIGRLKRAGELLGVRNVLIQQFSSGGQSGRALLYGAVTVLDLVHASGAALHLDGLTLTVGDAPVSERIDRVVEQLRERDVELPVASSCLAVEHPDIAEVLGAVAGLLIVPFGDGGDYLAWFRPEITETTEWLGDQRESNRASTFSPRSSFSAWSTSVSGRAEPWGGLEREAIAFGYDLESAILRSRESHLAHLGLHDELTGLPNRRLFSDRLEHALATRGREGEVALLFIDIDSFKSINDSLGHDGGDTVLVRIAERLRSAGRRTDTVARLGGDELVMLCENTDREAALRMADRVLAALRPPLTVAGRSLQVTASIGVATAQDGDTAADLMRRADTSMYQAKHSGKDQSAG